MPERYCRIGIGFLNCIFIELTMAKPATPVYFILMRDNDRAERKVKTGIKTKTEQTSALKGSLWTVDSREFEVMSRKSTATLRSAELKDTSLTCELQDITKLTQVEFNLLLALTTCKERSAFHSDNRLMGESTKLYNSWKEATQMAGMELPRVEVRDDRFEEVVTGVLKHVGEIRGRSGFWFGVEVDQEFQSLELSNTDATFDCIPNRGVLVVTANKILPLSTKGRSTPPGAAEHLPPLDAPWHSRTPETYGDLDTGTLLPSHAQNSPMRMTVEPGASGFDGVSRPEVDVGDRVVWYDESNAEQLATVRWIGRLNGKLTIGVENDRSVGSGTGKYHNEQLFVTQPNHASLIPAEGLLKAEVVYGSRDLVPQPPNYKGDVYVPAGTGAPAWEDAVLPEAVFRQMAPNGHRYLHSQSDSGTFMAPANPQALPTSASYDHIPSYRSETSTARHGQNPTNVSAGNVRSIQFESRMALGLGGNPLGRGGSQPVCDVTDVPRNTPVRGQEEAGDSRLTCKMTPTGVGSESEVVWSPRLADGAGSATTPIAGAKPGSRFDDPGSGAPTGRGGHSERFVPRSLGPTDLKTCLDVGSLVEVDIPGYNAVQYGVIRWMGLLKEGNKAYVGVELEEENMACTDGTFMNVRLFTCTPKKGFFTLLSRVRRDKRFAESSHFERKTDSAAFGSIECTELSGIYAHRQFETREGLENFLGTSLQSRRRPSSQQGDIPGRNMGIQGHHNSCYLDATLFSMFAFSSAFDSILHREKTPRDIRQYVDIQRVLRDGIVNPLRCQMFVRADKVLRLRNWLSECSSIQGLLDEEKDPDEFIISLLQETLQVEPFIKFSSGQSGFCYQLFLESDEKIKLPTTQQLLSLSLFQSDIKLLEVPRCLILQMPRFGRDYQMYGRIVPSLTLDVTNMLEHDPQPCCFCGKLASSECRDCFLEFGKGCDRAYFCKTCITMSHSPTMRMGHRPKDIPVYPESVEFYGRPNAPEIRSEILELFAVICIKTSHYISFSKCGSNPEAPWVFFDSMADRIGQQYGHNIPQLEICPELPNFLKDENRFEIMKCTDDKNLPDRMRRLLCDGYICLYQSPSLEPYQ